MRRGNCWINNTILTMGSANKDDMSTCNNNNT